MSKYYYSTYANHCFRFYFRYDKPENKCEVNYKNWVTCDSVISDYTDEIKEILRYLYSHYNEINNVIVNTTANKFKIKTQTLWSLINDCTKNFAKLRGLI